MKAKIWIVVLTLSIIHPTKAQFISSESYNLGALYAKTIINGPASQQSSLYTQGTYHLKSNAWAFLFSFNKMSHKKGLSLGPIFTCALGGSMDHFMRDDLGPGNSNIDGVWGKDFAIYIDWKIGLGLNYALPDKKVNFGLRYFNWYQGNPIGGSYSNADDAASLGLVVNWKKFGLTFSHGSDRIPGVLVNSHSWNSNEIEFKFQAKYNEKTRDGVIVGARYHSQIMQSGSGIANPNTKGNIYSLFVVIH